MNSGFLINRVLVAILAKKNDEERAKIMNRSFCLWYGIESGDDLSEDANVIAESIAECATEFATNRKVPLSNSERQRLYRERHKQHTSSEVTEVTEITSGMLRNGVTPKERKTERKEKKEGSDSVTESRTNSISLETIADKCKTLNIPYDFGAYFWNEMENLGWTAISSNGRTYTVDIGNVGFVLRNWWYTEEVVAKPTSWCPAI